MAIPSNVGKGKSIVYRMSVFVLPLKGDSRCHNTGRVAGTCGWIPKTDSHKNGREWVVRLESDLMSVNAQLWDMFPSTMTNRMRWNFISTSCDYHRQVETSSCGKILCARKDCFKIVWKASLNNKLQNSQNYTLVKNLLTCFFFFYLECEVLEKELRKSEDISVTFL